MSSPSDDPQLDGFSTVEGRNTAHRPIVEHVARLLDNGAASVLDLGCGGGALLAGICERHQGVRPIGVEIDVERAARARARLGPLGGDVVGADMFDVGSWADLAWGRHRVDVALLMPGRLLEARSAGDAEASAALIDVLGSNVDHVVVYAYGDWLTRFGDLEGLVAATGYEVASGSSTANGSPQWRSCADLVLPGPSGPARSFSAKEPTSSGKAATEVMSDDVLRPL